MATSGSTNYSQNRNQILEDALSMAGVLGEEEVISSVVLTKSNRLLNRIVKSLENEMLHLWKKAEATLFLQLDQESYVLGSGTTDHCTESYVSSTLDGAAAADDTVINVDDASSMSASDHIGIVLDAGDIHWTTITSITDNAVTIADAIAGDAADANAVYVYTTDIGKPLQILDARRRLISSAYDIPMIQLAYKDYMSMPLKETSGSATVQWAYNRGLDSGTFYVWQRPDNVDYVVKFTYTKSIEDFDSAIDSPDFPQEWLHFLVLTLAVHLAPMYGMLSAQSFNQLKQLADEAKAAVMSFDNDMEYVQLQVDTTGQV